MASKSGGNNNLKIVIGVVIAALLLVWLLWDDKPEYAWGYMPLQEVGSASEQPYSTLLYYRYMKSLRDEDHFVDADSLIELNLQPYLDSTVTDMNYIMVRGSGYYPDYNYNYNYAGQDFDQTQVDAIFEFVENGNSFFLIEEFPSYAIMKELNYGECQYYWPTDMNYNGFSHLAYDSVITCNFIHPDLKREEPFSFGHRVKSHYEKYSWHYMPDELFCESNVSYTVLGTIDGHVNFYRVPHGDGYFYFHCEPKCYTNYYMRHGDGLDYAESTAAFLASGDIIYDRKQYKERPYVPSASGGARRSTIAKRADSPLQFVLQTRGLRWGLYTLGIASFFVFLFAFRRKQRVVPVVLAKENTSIEYVETITQLYQQQGGQGKIQGLLSEQFLGFIRQRYRLKTEVRDDKFMKKLTKVSGINEESTRAIFKIMGRGAHAPNVDTDMLTEFYTRLTKFYKNCK